MNQNYNDDQNRPLMPMQPIQPIQPVQPATGSGGFMDYVRNNRMTVIIAVLILIGLIWWFCMRKPDGANVNITTNVPSATPAVPATNPSGIQVTKTRLGSNTNRLY
ncbi:hypothetical protein QJ857_gp1061 [Tupanvirus soda lake]|uniref:Uncharacterized protein n=2 Tax=Tupanvirus TaxID=2094720 RepID=A0A6N1NU54_9VIRU|nr:hypothetical protein QJ857_gp1061 [Tupanvirus soda lake]QKU34993.1 hypothetical protein [Tupanvirus soda lake]